MVSKQEIEDRIVAIMRKQFLKHTNEVLEKYSPQIKSTVSWYLKSIPQNVAKSEADDLASEARMAFMDALKNWDPRKADLWTYVSIRLKGSMQDYLRKKGMDMVSGMQEWITS